MGEMMVRRWQPFYRDVNWTSRTDGSTMFVRHGRVPYGSQGSHCRRSLCPACILDRVDELRSCTTSPSFSIAREGKGYGCKLHLCSCSCPQSRFVPHRPSWSCSGLFSSSTLGLALCSAVRGLAWQPFG
jgi:hypothetical protein